MMKEMLWCQNIQLHTKTKKLNEKLMKLLMKKKKNEQDLSKSKGALIIFYFLIYSKKFQEKRSKKEICSTIIIKYLLHSIQKLHICP